MQANLPRLKGRNGDDEGAAFDSMLLLELSSNKPGRSSYLAVGILAIICEEENLIRSLGRVKSAPPPSPFSSSHTGGRKKEQARLKGLLVSVLEVLLGSSETQLLTMSLSVSGRGWGLGVGLAIYATALLSAMALVLSDNGEDKKQDAVTKGKSCGEAAAPLDPSSFRGKTVLITGAGGGVGGALARRFAREGCALALHYNSSKQSCERLRDECLRLGAIRAEIFQADLGEAKEAKSLFDSVVEWAEGNKLDILINNAGRYEEQPEAVTAETYEAFVGTLDRAYKNCLYSAACLTFLFGAHCASRIARGERKGGEEDKAIGAIVNIGSRGAFRGEPTAWAYAATKSGQHALAQSASVTLAKHGVVITTLAPGFIGTRKKDAVLDGPRGEAIKAQSPWNRVAREEEVAEAAVTMSRFWVLPWVSGGIVDLNGASYLRG